MTTVMDFAALVERLSGSPLSGMGTPALSVRHTKNFFVPPLLNVTHDSTDANVTLLSARGAAGKSSTANAISEQTLAPVWRLEDDTSVSYSSVHSTLARHLDSVESFERISALDNPLLIIDSLDEARSRVSATSWSEFVGAIITAVRAGLRVVLLGRTRTLEDLWVTFEDERIPTAWYEISHFDNAARNKYVDSRARARDSSVNLTSAYFAARDAIFSALEKPLKSDDADRFVGYPPVLDAVAQVLIDRPNYMALENEFSALQLDSRTAVLDRILEELLQREQRKVAPLAADLGVTLGDAYSPEEQANWLLHDLAGAKSPEFLPHADTSTRMEYAERIRDFRKDHPFRNEREWASPVFEAYIVANHFDSAPEQVVLSAGDATGLLFELVCVASKGALVLSEIQFASLHASLLAGQWHAVESSVTLSSDGGNLDGEFRVAEPNAQDRLVGFVIDPERADLLTLAGPMTSLTVDVDCGVHIPSAADEVTLGPDLQISARSILVDGSRVAFGQRDTESGSADVELRATQQLMLPHSITPPLPRPGVVQIAPPNGFNLSFPWTDYYEAQSPSIPGIDERAVRFLNKFMNLTRSHGHQGDRAVFIKKFQGRQGLPQEQFRMALAELTSSGAAYIKGDMVFYSSSWEKHRYNGKSIEGQRQLNDCLPAWQDILLRITDHLE